jgi:hypothetical protein
VALHPPQVRHLVRRRRADHEPEPRRQEVGNIPFASMIPKSGNRFSDEIMLKQ